MGVTVWRSSDSDEVLWRAVVNGDGGALGCIFDRHSAKVYTHGARALGSWNHADDVASMAFFEAWQHADGVRFVEGSLLPWLILTATNLARNERRSRRRYRNMLGRLPPGRPESDIAEQAIADVDADALGPRLAWAMRSLPKREEEVIALCDIAGLSYSEVAAVLNIPVGTVKSRISRGRSSLRHLLGPIVSLTPHQDSQ